MVSKQLPADNLIILAETVRALAVWTEWIRMPAQQSDAVNECAESVESGS
jgi:hypothetical protein